MRRGATLVAAVVLLAGCTATTTTQTTTTTHPSASIAPADDLTRPGAARRAVTALVKASGGLPIIKLDLSSTTATLSCRKSGGVVAWQWSKGQVTAVDSDITDIQQATFDPAKFRFDDLRSIFATAKRISGSDSQQELQVVEYDQGQVMMTVTTRPESMPVFFRPDGTAVNNLAFPSTAAFTEAIRDATSNGRRVLAMGWSQDGGMWADSAATPGVVERVTRQAKVPAWSASRKADTTTPSFRAAEVDPAVLSRLVSTLPDKLGTPGAKVTFEIRRQQQMALPVITFDVAGQRVVTTLDGIDVTGYLG